MIWRSWPVPRNEGTAVHRTGGATLCVSIEQAGDGDVLAALARYAEDDAPGAKRAAQLVLPPLDDPAWSRYYSGKADHYELEPGYPELPVCVRLHEPFRLPPGADLRGWIFSHLEAKLKVGHAIAGAFPLKKPYKTLYGPPDAGVICRYDEADFLASDEPATAALHDDPSLVAHPVRLRNSSSDPVLVEELCIYGEQLSVFGVGRHMQSERLLFVFNSSGVRMSLEGQGALPPGAKLLSRPTVSGEERFIERSFELFKAITRI